MQLYKGGTFSSSSLVSRYWPIWLCGINISTQQSVKSVTKWLSQNTCSSMIKTKHAKKTHHNLNIWHVNDHRDESKFKNASNLKIIWQCVLVLLWQLHTHTNKHVFATIIMSLLRECESVSRAVTKEEFLKKVGKWET